MVYKLGNVDDLAMIPSIDASTLDTLYAYVSVLTNEYGSERDVDRDDGGYVLYATKGTNCEEIKNYFDYLQNKVEYVNRSNELCEAVFILHNEYAVTVIAHITDAPPQITEAFEEGY